MSRNTAGKTRKTKEIAELVESDEAVQIEQLKNVDVPINWEQQKVQKANTGMMRIRQQKFLKAFTECGNLSDAAKMAGINKATESKWRQTGDKWYIERFKEAMETFRDAVGSVVHSRAIDGIEMPIVGKKLVLDHTGNPIGLEDAIIGTKRVYDSNLLMFEAKKVDPRYKEKYEEPHEHDKPNETVSPMTRITIQLNMMRERQNQKIIDITPERKSLTESTESDTETVVTVDEG